MLDLKATAYAMIIGVVVITVMYLAFIAIKLAIVLAIMGIAYFITKKRDDRGPPGPSIVNW